MGNCAAFVCQPATQRSWNVFRTVTGAPVYGAICADWKALRTQPWRTFSPLICASVALCTRPDGAKVTMTEPRVPLAPHWLARPAALAKARRAALVSNPSGATALTALAERCGASALASEVGALLGGGWLALAGDRAAAPAPLVAEGFASADPTGSGRDAVAGGAARGAGCKGGATATEATTGINGVAGAAPSRVPARRAATAAIMTATPANIQTARSALLSPPRSTKAEGGSMDVVAGAGTEGGGKDDGAGCD
jgi:hypothetical protein